MLGDISSSIYSSDARVNKDVIMTYYFDDLSKFNETKSELWNRHLRFAAKIMCLAGTNEGTCMK